MTKALENRIFLDYPLDLLLNRGCELREYEEGIKQKLIDSIKTGHKIKGKIKGEIGGIKLPEPDDANSSYTAGSGNILIKGRPGSGKSTLAMQIAIAGTFKPNNYSAIYISLEESAQYVMEKYDRLTSWKGKLREVCFLDNINESSSPEAIGNALKRLLTQKKSECKIFPGVNNACKNHMDFLKTEPAKNVDPCVLLPELSPRSIIASPQETDTLFWERFRQLEMLLIGAKWLRDKNDLKLPPIRMLCIDSLNVFGDKPMTREEYFKLFDLCKRYGVIGVFTAELDGESFEQSRSNVMDYLSDVIIHLSQEEDNGYALRYFEIKKSRYQHEVYGKHPFRLRGEDVMKDKNDYFQPLMVQPSLHYIVSRTIPSDKPKQLPDDYFDIGFLEINDSVLATYPKKLPRGSVVTIRGPRNTFKTNIALNFLFSGIFRSDEQNSESSLHIRLHEDTLFKPASKFRLSKSNLDSVSNRWPSDNFHPISTRGTNDAKRKTAVFCYYSGKPPIPPEKPPYFIELALKSGALLPEEFIEIVRDIIREQKKYGAEIKRVVLDDVGLIGTSYPFLRKSKTAGDLFLTSLIHVLRHNNIDFVITGNTGQHSASDEVVERASSLADTVLKCDLCDIFGDRYVTISGDGLTKGQTSGVGDIAEFVPGVIEPIGADLVEVNLTRLQGLVGFDKGNIHRPGLVMNLFSEGDVIGKYNKEIGTMLRSAFALPHEGTSNSDEEFKKHVSVNNFTPDTSAAVHDSLDIIGNKPIDKTLLCTIDEFYWSTDSIKEKKALVNLRPLMKEDENLAKEDPKYWKRFKFLKHDDAKPRLGVPYYASALVLAYNTTILDTVRDKLPEPFKSKGLSKKTNTFWTPNSWNEIAQIIRKLKTIGKAKNTEFFDYDDWALETMSCVLIDALFSCQTPKGIPINMDDFLSQSSTPAIRKNIITQFSALHTLFSHSYRFQYRNKMKKPKYDKVLHPNAAFYLCWYSQLRQLMNDHPVLQKQIRVAPLPGNGFTGDWFLGIVKGSVSVNLGIDVVKKLCDEQEDYKRYIRGVGLPVSKKFYKPFSSTLGFLAWPYSQQILNVLGEVHKNAWKRSDIENYQKFRSALGIRGAQLAKYDGGDISGFVTQMVDRLPDTINRLINGLPSPPISPPPQTSKSHRTRPH